MTIRSKSTRKKDNAVAHEKKRQPFGVIVDGASQKKNKSPQGRNKQRRKSRQIGDHVILFVSLRFCLVAVMIATESPAIDHQIVLRDTRTARFTEVLTP